MNNLKKIREERNFSQLDLAKLTDITPSDLSRIENAKIHVYPGWRKRISKALEVDESEIWEE